MAVTSYGVNDTEAVKLWSRKLFREALKNTSLAKLMGEGTNNAIQILDDTAKGPGDRVRVTLRMQLAGAGIAGDETLEGSEEELVTHTDDLFIDQLRHATRSGGRMSEQRVPFSVRSEGEQALRDWWADRIDTALFNQLAGNTAQSDNRFTGMQDAIAASSNRIFRPNGETADEDLTTTASESMSLSVIDSLVERAKTSTPLVRPLMMGGQPYYLMLLHPFQVTSMRTNTNTGDWLDIQKAAMQGGRVTNNPIFTGALGVHNGVILMENTRVPNGIHSTTGDSLADVRRAIFMGAQAAAFATGRQDSPNEMTWVEELFDYQNQLGISAGMIWGAKKIQFNSEDFGVFVAPTLAVQSS